MKRYQAISLDAGYTLLEPVRDGDVHVADLLRDLGHPVEMTALHAAGRAATHYFFEMYLTPGNDTWSVDKAIHAMWLRYYQIMLAELGVDDQDLSLSEQIIEDYNQVTNWRFYPEVPEVLETLKARGYRLGIVSDWSSQLPGILRHLGLTRYLDWVLASGQIGYAKPQPAFYRLAASRAGAPPTAMVHVGDSYYADVRGARAAGMDAIFLDRHRYNPPTDCPVIQDLRQLLALL